MRAKEFYRNTTDISLYFAVFTLSFFMMAAASAEDMNTRASTWDSYHPGWERATNEELDALRGGFILPNGVHVEMSLEKFIHLNDVLVHSSSFQLPGEGVLLQAGVQNLVSGSVTMPELSTFIQNTLDSQSIDALTKIDIEISNLKGVTRNNGSHRVFTEFMAPALLR